APCGRRADSNKTFPHALANCHSDPHCIGEVWSSMLRSLRASQGLDGNGQSVIDRDVLASQFMYVNNETFSAAVNDLVAADQDLYGGLHKAAICNAATQRAIVAGACT